MKIKILLAVLVSSLSVSAQNYVDIARLYYNNTALNNFENSTDQTRVTEMGLDLNYPIVLKSGSAFLTGFSYEQTHLKLDAGAEYEIISSIVVRMGLNKKYSDKLSGTYTIIPKLASDFEQPSPHNFQLGALALMKFSRHDQLNYKVGIYANSELFGPFIVPLVGMYYLHKNKKLETNILLPSLADVNYKLNKVLTFGMNFTLQIRSYHLSDVETTSQPGYVVKNSNDACAYLKFNFTQQISLQTRVGYSVARTYRVFNEGDQLKMAVSLIKIGDDREQLNTEFSNGLVYQAILLYRFWQK